MDRQSEMGFLYLILIVTSALVLSSETKAEDSRQNTGIPVNSERGIPPEVFAFLEKIVFQIDSVRNVNGNLKEFLDLNQTTLIADNFSFKDINSLPAMELSLTNGKSYEAQWFDSDGNRKVYLSFPANYEVIYGQRKNKIENKIKGEIKSHSSDWNPIAVDADMELLNMGSGIFKRPNENILEINAMTDNIYLIPDSIGFMKPVFDNNFKEHSAINLLQGVIDDISEYKIYLKHDKYDSNEEFTVDLAQWLNFCRSLPAKVYCGLEEERDDGLKMLVLIDVYPLGFRHMLSVILPSDFIEKKNSILKGKLYTYIPSHNVRSMYYDLIYKKQ